MERTWPFDQPENCAVLATRQVMLEGAPVLLVSHDEDDHGWQFLSGEDCRSTDLVLVLLKNVVSKDASILEVADLPPGWQARRTAKGAPWVRHPAAEETPEHDR